MDFKKEIDNDEDLIQWRRILDLESASKMDTDWYSTKTFQGFLDALDINQPVINDDKNKTVKIKPETSKIEEQSATGDKYQRAETILSAEALKILSELPDLSHMSSTRSFIFPNGSNAQKRT